MIISLTSVQMYLTWLTTVNDILLQVWGSFSSRALLTLGFRGTDTFQTHVPFCERSYSLCFICFFSSPEATFNEISVGGSWFGQVRAPQLSVWADKVLKVYCMDEMGVCIHHMENIKLGSSGRPDLACSAKELSPVFQCDTEKKPQGQNCIDGSLQNSAINIFCPTTNARVAQ